jgi:hypothetical protein
VDEARKRLWDVWLGILGPILTVLGLLVGVWQFNIGEHNRVILEGTSKNSASPTRLG